jgi:prefoldin subunit 5
MHVHEEAGQFNALGQQVELLRQNMRFLQANKQAMQSCGS